MHDVGARPEAAGEGSHPVVILILDSLLEGVAKVAWIVARAGKGMGNSPAVGGSG
jgi:hypothetical protein